jgi:hypothetical protein
MFNRFLGAFLDQGSFHLGKPRQQSNDQWGEFPQSPGVDQSIERPDVDPLGLQVT